MFNQITSKYKNKNIDSRNNKLLTLFNVNFFVIKDKRKMIYYTKKTCCNGGVNCFEGMKSDTEELIMLKR